MNALEENFQNLLIKQDKESEHRKNCLCENIIFLQKRLEEIRNDNLIQVDKRLEVFDERARNILDTRLCKSFELLGQQLQHASNGLTRKEE